MDFVVQINVPDRTSGIGASWVENGSFYLLLIAQRPERRVERLAVLSGAASSCAGTEDYQPGRNPPYGSA